MASRSKLTQKELQVASLLANRRTNAEISREMEISANTVKHHVSMVLLKLGVDSRLQVEQLTDFHNDEPGTN